MPEVSEKDELLKQVRFYKTQCIIALVIALLSIIVDINLTPKIVFSPPIVETTGLGTVVVYTDQVLVHKSPSGYLKILEPLCNRNYKVWTNKQAGILFHWSPYATWKFGNKDQQCYQIDSIVEPRN